MRTIEDILKRLRAEYLEMPGLQLTAEQVQRLCGIEPKVCQSALDALVDAKFLCVTSGGHYARLTDGEIRRSASREGRPESRPAFREGFVTSAIDPRHTRSLDVATTANMLSTLAMRSTGVHWSDPSSRRNAL